MLPRLHLSMFFLSAVLLLAHSKPAHSESQLPEPATTTKKVMTRKEPLQPVPAAVGLDPKKVELGEKLFHEPQLSRDNKVSCATRHDLKTSGVDNKACKKTRLLVKFLHTLTGQYKGQPLETGTSRVAQQEKR
jgi:cytochrome c peroxidase